MGQNAPVADRILSALQTHRSMDRTTIRKLLGRNVPGVRISRALNRLTEAGVITVMMIKPMPTGRPRTIVRLAGEPPEMIRDKPLPSLEPVHAGTHDGSGG